MTKKLTYFLLACAAAVTVFFISSAPKSFEDKLDGYAGSDCSGCHSGSVNGPNDFVLTGLPATYTPNQTYLITVCLTDTNKSAGGFALFDDDGSGSTRNDAFTLISGEGTRLLAANAYVTHNAPKAFDGNSTACWDVSWTAPAAGDRLLRGAGNAVNSNNSPGGDNGGYTLMQGTTAGVLPVDLVDFTAVEKDNDIILEWETATEINNEYFSVERSFDLRNYEEIARIAGEGTTDEDRFYSFVDNDAPVNQPIYYRLKQVDFDGAFEYSLIEKVIIERAYAEVNRVYPNPVFGSETVKVDVEILRPTDRAELVVSDIFGHQKMTKTVSVFAGKNTLEFSANDLTGGNYYVTLNIDNQIVTSEMLIVAQ